MKTHTTNYINTLIAIADDCPVSSAEKPPVKEGKRSVANIQFDLIGENPYKYTSDDVIFQVYAEKNDLTKNEYAAAREQFFSKGQPCLRTSPLTKRYGWGVHSDEKGRIALYACDSKDYQRLIRDASLKVVKAMKSGK